MVRKRVRADILDIRRLHPPADRANGCDSGGRLSAAQKLYPWYPAYLDRSAGDSGDLRLRDQWLEKFLLWIDINISQLQIRIDVFLQPDAVGVAVGEEEVGSVIFAMAPPDL